MDDTDQIDDTEGNEINNNIITNNTINETDTYINIIDALGLNINITYPLNMIVNTIIELHVTPLKTNNFSKYARNYTFKSDQYSKKLEKNIGGHGGMLFSYKIISRAIVRSYRHYKYNSIVNNVKPSIKNEIIGFNYDNPCWNMLKEEIC